MSQVNKCEECEGMGVVVDEHLESETSSFESQERQCEECNGTGEVLASPAYSDGQIHDEVYQPCLCQRSEKDQDQ